MKEIWSRHKKLTDRQTDRWMEGQGDDIIQPVFRLLYKNVNFWASKSFIGQIDFDHLLVHGQVIKFDNSTTL